MSNEPEHKNLTLDDLAAMVQRGFADNAEEVKTMRKEMSAGFERIEKILLAKQEKRIEKLEKEVQELKDALAM
jgi:hypothetical protein